jgi:hypothetical protein
MYLGIKKFDKEMCHHYSYMLVILWKKKVLKLAMGRNFEVIFNIFNLDLILYLNNKLPAKIN